jgi:crotonobetaine/carnitine-CoA ligase
MRERDEMVLGDQIQIRAEQNPDLDVLTFEHLSLDGGATPDEVRTFADLASNANRIAASLVARGMAPGDRFGLMMRNHPEFVESMIAASMTGCVFVPIDPRTRGDKLAYMLRNAGCRGVVCADYSLREVLAARSANRSGPNGDDRPCPAYCGIAWPVRRRAIVAPARA